MILFFRRIGKIIKHIVSETRRQCRFRMELIYMVFELFGRSRFKLLYNLFYQRIIVAQLEKITPVVVAARISDRRYLDSVSFRIVVILAYTKLNRLSYIA
jgi:hypothetical protein